MAQLKSTTISGTLNTSGNITATGGQVRIEPVSDAPTHVIYKYNQITVSKAGTAYNLSFPDASGTISLLANLYDGNGTNSIRMNQDGGATFSFNNKNPNATTLSGNTLTGSLVNGAGTFDSSHTGQYAASFGGKSLAAGKRSLAQGTTTVAIGNYSHAEGDNSVSWGNDSHAEGNATVSYGGASHSEGTSTQAIGNNSHVEGNATITNSINSHAEGYQSQTLTSSSSLPSIPAYGSGSGGSGSGSGGGGTPTANQTGDASHAEGISTNAAGNASHTEGISTWATAYGSHAEGYGSQATNDYAHAEGFNCLASGYGAHATGVHTIASGNYSFTQGQQTVANGNACSAFGKGTSNTSTTSEAQMVIGTYNEGVQGTLFEVGNGTDASNRSNAFEVYEDGHAEVGVSPRPYTKIRIAKSGSTPSPDIAISDGWGDGNLSNNSSYPYLMYTYNIVGITLSVSKFDEIYNSIGNNISHSIKVYSTYMGSYAPQVKTFVRGNVTVSSYATSNANYSSSSGGSVSCPAIYFTINGPSIGFVKVNNKIYFYTNMTSEPTYTIIVDVYRESTSQAVLDFFQFNNENTVATIKNVNDEIKANKMYNHNILWSANIASTSSVTISNPFSLSASFNIMNSLSVQYTMYSYYGDEVKFLYYLKDKFKTSTNPSSLTSSGVSSAGKILPATGWIVFSDLSLFLISGIFINGWDKTNSTSSNTDTNCYICFTGLKLFNQASTGSGNNTNLTLLPNGQGTYNSTGSVFDTGISISTYSSYFAYSNVFRDTIVPLE